MNGLPERVRLVIFDLDGVIMDSEQRWNGAKEALVRETGGRWRDERCSIDCSSPASRQSGMCASSGRSSLMGWISNTSVGNYRTVRVRGLSCCDRPAQPKGFRAS